MNKFGNFFQPLTWFMALLLAGLVAGCGGDDDAAPAPSAAGAVCSGGTGPAAPCVDLLTAGKYVILAQSGIDSIPTSAITGIVGLSPAAGSLITGLTCAEVTGSISAVDATGPAPCSTVDAGLTQAVTDSGTARTTDAQGRPNGPTGVNPTAGTLNTANSAAAVPGVYTWTTGVAIQSDFTLTGSATDVWIFRIGGTLSQAAGTNVILAGGALTQNVFWVTNTNVVLGAGAHLEGIVLAGTTIVPGNLASVNGRLYSGTAVNLDANTVTRP